MTKCPDCGKHIDRREIDRHMHGHDVRRLVELVRMAAPKTKVQPKPKPEKRGRR